MTFLERFRGSGIDLHGVVSRSASVSVFWSHEERGLTDDKQDLQWRQYERVS